MKIDRRGARADNGPSGIELNNLQVSIAYDGIVLKDFDVGDFVTKSHYNYTIAISLEEFGTILQSVASSEGEARKRFGEYLGSTRLKDLLRVIQMAIEP